MCSLEKTQHSCFNHQLQQCLGACVQKESASEYNKRVALLINKYSFQFENFYILDHGTHRNEKSIILVQDGTYRGYGKIPFYALDKRKDSWKRFIDFSTEDRDAKTIISNYLRVNEYLKIIQF